MWLIIGISGATCSGKSSLAHALHKRLPGSLLLCQDDFFLPVDSEKHTWIHALNHINWEIMSSLDMERMHATVENILASKDRSVFSPNSSLDVAMKVSDASLASDEVHTVLPSDKDGVVGILEDSKSYEKNESVLATSHSKLVTETNTDDDIVCVTCDKKSKVEVKDYKGFAEGISVLIIEGFLILNDKKLAEICHLKYFMTLTKEQCWERRRVRTYDPADVPGYFEQYVWPEYEKHSDQVLEEIPDVILLDGTVDRNVVLNKVLQDITKVTCELFGKNDL